MPARQPPGVQQGVGERLQRLTRLFAEDAVPRRSGTGSGTAGRKDGQVGRVHPVRGAACGRDHRRPAPSVPGRACRVPVGTGRRGPGRPRVVAALDPTVAERGAVVRVGDLPPAWGDRTAVEQVFANLVGNALTYLDPARPGRIEVGCLPRVRGGRRVPDVLRPGQRAGHPRSPPGEDLPGVPAGPPRRREGRGAGAGHWPALAERHRGRVWVESEPGEGSTFFVTLPTRRVGDRRDERPFPPRDREGNDDCGRTRHPLAEDDEGHASRYPKPVGRRDRERGRSRQGRPEALDYIRSEGEYAGRRQSNAASPARH